MTHLEYALRENERADAELFLLTARALQSMVDPRTKPATAAMCDKLVAEGEREMAELGA